MFSGRPRLLRWLVTAAVVAITIGASARAEAGTIQLGLILDNSGNMGTGDWGIITCGLAVAVSPATPFSGPDTSELSVVTFANRATLNQPHVLTTFTAIRANLAATIPALPIATIPDIERQPTIGERFLRQLRF